MLPVSRIVIMVICSYCLHRDQAEGSFTNLMMSGAKASLTLAESVAIGVQRGMEECQVQFRWDRWNCPRNAFTVFSKVDNPSVTREMAFVHAIISAGITYTLTRNCSLGHFDSCSCDNSRKGTVAAKGWTWGGCSDNIRFGEKMAKEFLDTRERGRDVNALVNLHNNRIGRLAVKKTMKRMCKCHGVSGSCATVTCWMRLADMHVVGRRLKKTYERAKRVEYNENGKPTNGLLGEGVPGFKPTKKSLFYTASSPNYCHANVTAGANGTKGRECSLREGKKTSRSERESCRNLCYDCGLGVRHEESVQRTSCNCKFIWCCEVKCEECTNKVRRTFCD